MRAIFSIAGLILGVTFALNAGAASPVISDLTLRPNPNEAAPLNVAGIGDINNDSFDDIAIGNPKADFIDLSFPQGPEATDASVGRRRNAGDVYVIYGNNFGQNRIVP